MESMIMIFTLFLQITNYMHEPSTHFFTLQSVTFTCNMFLFFFTLDLINCTLWFLTWSLNKYWIHSRKHASSPMQMCRWPTYVYKAHINYYTMDILNAHIHAYPQACILCMYVSKMHSSTWTKVTRYNYSMYKEI